MQPRTKARLAMGAFLAACLVPSLGMLVRPEPQAAANQTPAPPPALLREDGGLNPDVLQEATDYIAGHFAFRQELITADAALNAAVFGVSVEEKVLLGREGWLFYRETLDGYLHTRLMGQRQLWAGARCLGLMQEYAWAHGARFLFTVAPNKASLYPQYLPSVGQPLEGESDAERLVPLLEAEGIAYADLFAAFRAQEAVLYFPQDSHWNAQGAALAQKTLLDALGKDYEPFWMSEGRWARNHRGDLYEMLYPAGNGLDWDMQFDRGFAFTHVREPRGPDDQRIETEQPARTGNLLMFRDSFGNNLYPFLAEEYGRALFSRSMPYRMELLGQSGADTVVVELVERNLGYLAAQAPILPAPERLLSGTPAQGEGEGRAIVSARHPLEGYARLEGVLAGGADESSPVYVQLGERLYEASPAGEDWSGGPPFTLYVPQDAPLGEGRVLCMQGGVLCSLPLQIEWKDG